jgi:hypothetical protein
VVDHHHGQAVRVAKAAPRSGDDGKLAALDVLEHGLRNNAGLGVLADSVDACVDCGLDYEFTHEPGDVTEDLCLGDALDQFGTGTLLEFAGIIQGKTLSDAGGLYGSDEGDRRFVVVVRSIVAIGQRLNNFFSGNDNLAGFVIQHNIAP